MDSLDVNAKLMANGFKEDPRVIVQFQEIKNWQEFFELHCKATISTFEKLGCVTTYGNGEGLVIGYFTKDLDSDKLAQYSQENANYFIDNSSVHDLESLQKNSLEVAEIVKSDWYMKYIENDNVYVLQVIVVDKLLRGTGIFRKLIDPILDLAGKQNIPVVLQTHIRENIAKFEHFGFKLIESVSSDKLNLSCYNMMKLVPERKIN